MSAHAGAGLEDVDAGMAVGQLHHVPDVDAEAPSHPGEFVGVGDVDVAVGVFRQLDQFSRGRVGDQAFAFDKNFVELDRAGRAPGAETADHPVV